MSDTLYLDCTYCGKRLWRRTVDTEKNAPPSETERAYLRAAKHIRREHIGFRKEKQR